MWDVGGQHHVTNARIPSHLTTVSRLHVTDDERWGEGRRDRPAMNHRFQRCVTTHLHDAISLSLASIASNLLSFICRSLMI